MSSHIGVDNQSVESEWVHCNHCLHQTKHSVLFDKVNRRVEKYSGYDLWWNARYTLFTCLGCESITLRHELSCSEWTDGFDMFSEIEFFPPQVSRQLPKWRDELPKDIRELMTEVYTALHSGSRRLALMGARTLIDMFILDKIGDVGTFKQKLETLRTKGYLGSNHETILNVALEAGNAATHRGYQPSSEVLNHVIDIVESLLQFYALENASNSVKGKFPARSKI